MSLPPAQATPLDYATPDADGVPDFVPEAEAAIERGESVKAISSMLPDPTQTQRYLEKSFARRFGLDAAGRECAACGAVTDFIATVFWTYLLQIKRRSFTLSDKREDVTVISYHAICATCADRWRQRTRVAQLCRRIGSGTIVATTLCFGVVQLVRWWFNLRGGGLTWVPAATIGCLLAGLVLERFGARSFHARTPLSVRRLMPRWMRCTRLFEVEHRDAIFDDEQVPEAAPAAVEGPDDER